METLTHAINWFEIPVTDFARAKKFYTALYDFEMPEHVMGPNRMGFFQADTTKGGIGGAIVKGDGYVPCADGAQVYLNGGKDLATVLARVESAGGKVLVPKTKITDEIGYFAVFTDTEGNKVSLHSRA